MNSVRSIFWGTNARAAALATVAAVTLVPANVFPVMHMENAGNSSADPTIFGGVKLLWDEGLWGLGAIVFTASILVPLLKLFGVAWLLWSAPRATPVQSRRLIRLHTIIEGIGRWSMLDVFLVAFLSGAVRFGSLATIEPRSGIIAFATAVVLTMLATQAVDLRQLWPDHRGSDIQLDH